MARELTGKKIVIVGATGILGAQLASQLSQAGAVVSAVVRDAAALDSAVISQHAIAGVAPKLPQGLEPAAAAARIVRAIVDGVRDLPVEAFTA